MTKGQQRTEISWVDVVVICALSVEFQALAEKLTRDPELVADAELGLDHFLVHSGGLTVLVVRLPEPGAGNVTSGVVASLLIERYDPWLLISFGIAGTLDSAVKTFDVVYSRSVFYLDLRKETGAGSSVMKQPVQRSTPPDLRRLLGRLPASHEYKRHEADIVTSEAVVKSEESERRRAARSAVADAKAVEMEAFGIFQAAFVDKESFSKTSRLCLALKGISDAADSNKSDDPHEGASRNAAETLSMLLQMPELADLRERSGVDQRPRPLQPFIRLRPQDIFDCVKAFRNIAQSILRPDWDDSTLHAVHMHCRHPHVFYHWRLTGIGLHWVEFKFARVLRRLSDAGYNVECLITDELLEMPQQRLQERQIPEARELTRRIIDAILPSDSESAATFYSDIRKSEDKISSYAHAAGYWSEIRKKLGLLGSIPTMHNAKLSDEFNEWLQYVAWRVRREGGCIIFYFCDREIYSLLWRFNGLLPALIPTADLILGGELGKFGSPGKDLFILPPDSPDIVQWLETTSDSETLDEFWRHLIAPIAQENTAREVLIRSRRSWGLSMIEKFLPRGGEPSWVECFLTGEEKKPEYYKGAILLELAWLNQEFFAGFREQPTG